MSAMFPEISPDPEEKPALIGIAKMAAQGVLLDEGHKVEYHEISNRSVLARCKSTRVPFAWMINPYRGCEFACKYCYARYTHEFMELRDSLDFERKIYVKQHTAWLLRQELKKVKRGEEIAIGSATDPYQPAERRFGVTRAIMEELARHRGLDMGMVTKSDLILRDLDVLQEVSRNNGFMVCVTVTTTGTELARKMEPRAPRPDLRLKALKKLVEAGIYAGVNCSPVLPGITDSPAELEKVVKAAGEVGAKFVHAGGLFLKPCAMSVFMPFLEEHFPKLVPMYKQRYARSAFLPAEYQRSISVIVKKLCEKHGVVSVRKPVASVDEVVRRYGAQQMRLFG